MNSSSDSSASFFSQPAVLGIFRGLIGFPFEHPFEFVKFSAQANPGLSSKEVAFRIFRQHGLLGFTNTLLTNFPRKVIRESARWTIIHHAHYYLTDKYPCYFVREGVASKIVTGASVALFDSCLLLPFDQLIAYRVKENERYRTFYKNRFKRDGVLSLYRGFRVNLMRQGAAWSSFLAMNYEVKKLFEVIDKNNVHPYLRQAATSLVIATTLTGIVLPIDFVKVRIQMDVDLQKKPLSEVVHTLHQRYNLKGFYSGYLATLVCTIFQATVKGMVADALFKQSSKAANN